MPVEKYSKGGGGQKEKLLPLPKKLSDLIRNDFFLFKRARFPINMILNSGNKI